MFRNILAILVVLMVLLFAGTASADHHPPEMCQPIVTDGSYPDPGAVNCAKGGEPQNHTFYVENGDGTPGLSVGDHIMVPLRFNDLSNDNCEAGWKIAYSSPSLSFQGQRFVVADFTSEELDHLAITEDPTVTLLPGVSHMQPTTFGGGVEPTTSECSDCSLNIIAKIWAYTGSNKNPMYPMGDRDRIFMWLDFEVKASAAGKNLRISQNDGWITKALPGEMCNCTIGPGDRACDPLTHIETWTDLPNGVETNQADFNVECWTADFNRDGVVGGPDFAIFNVGFNFNEQEDDPYYRELRPDCNDDGVVGGPDFSCFTARFNAQDASCW